MNLTASMTHVVAFMVFFVVIPLVAFRAEIVPRQKGWHTGDYIIVLSVIVQIYFILCFRTAVDDPIEMIL